MALDSLLTGKQRFSRQEPVDLPLTAAGRGADAFLRFDVYARVSRPVRQVRAGDRRRESPGHHRSRAGGAHGRGSGFSCRFCARYCGATRVPYRAGSRGSAGRSTAAAVAFGESACAESAVEDSRTHRAAVKADFGCSASLIVSLEHHTPGFIHRPRRGPMPKRACGYNRFPKASTPA